MYLKTRDYNEFIKKLNYLIKDSDKVKKNNCFFAVLIDIDYFHKITHINSDDIIILMYKQLSSITPNTFYLGRDEFSFYIFDKNVENLIINLAEIKNKIFNKYNISFSAGIAEYPKHGDDPIELLRYLEESVYQAKEQGRNNISFINDNKMKLKSNYYTPTQLNRLSKLARELNRSEASLLREALDEFLRKYES